MLADAPISVQTGRLDPEIHLPGTARDKLLDFIGAELPRWRDDPDRKPNPSETSLTSSLCEHLNSAARGSAAWSRIQFRTEIPDEVKPGRSIDLAAKPCGATIVIAGRRHTHFETLIPIECKRLPTPKDKLRDEREYIVTNPGTTGGVQRFKFGHHGADHEVAAMIGYIQDGEFSHWLKQVNKWVQLLSSQEDSGWTAGDCLEAISSDTALGVATLKSRHDRGEQLSAIFLRHLWIAMN